MFKTKTIVIKTLHPRWVFISATSSLPPPEWIHPITDTSDVITPHPPKPSPYLHHIISILNNTDPSHIEHTLNSFCNKHLIRLTPSFISHVLKPGPGPGRVDFLTRPELVYKFFRWAGSQKGVCKYKYFHDLECYVHVIEVLCLCKDFVKVKVVFDEVKDKRFVMDLKCANLLIRSFGNVGMVEELLWVWREMKRSGVEPSLFTFNFLLNGLVNSMFVESAEQVFEVMEKGVVKPDVVSFNTMIKGYCKIGRTSKAVEVFGKMEEANVERDKISYLTLMQACYADGDYDSCLKLYNEMEEKGVEVPEHGYSLVIGGLCKDGKPMEGYTLFENMIQKGCKANVAMYTSLMDACAKSGHIDEVIRIFERMNRDGFKPDEVTYVG